MEIRKQNCENRKPKFWTEETKIVEIRNQIHGNNLFQIRNQIVKKKKNQNCGNKKPKLWKYKKPKLWRYESKFCDGTEARERARNWTTCHLVDMKNTRLAQRQSYRYKTNFATTFPSISHNFNPFVIFLMRQAIISSVSGNASIAKKDLRERFIEKKERKN